MSFIIPQWRARARESRCSPLKMRLGMISGPPVLVNGNVCGSYMHLIDLAAAP